MDLKKDFLIFSFASVGHPLELFQNDHARVQLDEVVFSQENLLEMNVHALYSILKR